MNDNQAILEAVTPMLDDIKAKILSVPYEAHKDQARAILRANTNADAVISSEELAKAIFESKSLNTPESQELRSKLNCSIPMHEPVIEHIRASNQIAAVRMLDALREPASAIPARAHRDAIILTTETLERTSRVNQQFAQFMASREGATLKQNFTAAMEEAMVIRDKQVKQAQQELEAAGEVKGELPTQVLPLQKKDVCRYLGGKST